MAPADAPRGTVVAVRGSVVDVRFPAGCLPRIEDALVIEDRETGRVLVEVQAHVAEDRVRTVALAATAGLRRGDPQLFAPVELTLVKAPTAAGETKSVTKL